MVSMLRGHCTAEGHERVMRGAMKWLWCLAMVSMLRGHCTAFLHIQRAGHFTFSPSPLPWRRHVLALAKGPATSDLALEEWVDRMGVVRSVQIGYGAFGRGLIATRNIEAGEAAVRVPRTLALSDLKLPQPLMTNDGMPPAVCELHYTARLAAALSYEMSLGSNSTFKEYIKALPPSIRTLHKWDASLQRQLRNNTLEAEADGIFFWRYNNWEAMQDALSQLPGADAYPAPWLAHDPFMSALDAVCSRTLRIDAPLQGGEEGRHEKGGGGIDGGGGGGAAVAAQFKNYQTIETGEFERVMVPFLDLANHSPRGGRFDVEGQDICLFVADNIKAGEEVFLDYGARSNDQFLLHYGFLPHPNPADAVAVPLPNGSTQQITWTQLDQPLPADLRKACGDLLLSLETSLEDDSEALRLAEARVASGSCEGVYTEADGDLVLALRYRVAKRHLLAAAAGSNDSLGWLVTGLDVK